MLKKHQRNLTKASCQISNSDPIEIIFVNTTAIFQVFATLGMPFFTRIVCLSFLYIIIHTLIGIDCSFLPNPAVCYGF